MPQIKYEAKAKSRCIFCLNKEIASKSAMKFIFYVLLPVLITFNLDAQVFAPNDAIWHYSYDPDITLDDGYQRVEVSRDTVINQRNCKVLSTTNIGYNFLSQEYYEFAGEDIIIYEEDSIVYYLKSDSLFVLYDFAAKKGDSYTSICYPGHCDSTFQVTIDSISYIKHNLDSLKAFHISINDEVTSFYYVERLGYSDYILPMFNVGCDELTGPNYPGPFRCYQDGIIGLYSTGVATDCDYITGVQKISQDSKFSLYPNPAHNTFVIYMGDDQEYSYEIRNSYGGLLDRNSFQGEISIQMAAYESGIYFVTLRRNEAPIGTRKVLKY